VSVFPVTHNTLLAISLLSGISTSYVGHHRANYTRTRI